MILWLDAQLSPQLAPWLESKFGVATSAVRDLGLRDATDREIFAAAREAGAVVITKDRDFILLLAAQGPPPQVLWLTCGNTSNARLQAIFEALFPAALKLLEHGEPLVEIADLTQ
jgi:predicted nuclease of predicted toxin-antitoxin system